MVQNRGQFTKSMGKFARLQNRHMGSDSDEGSESEEDEDEEQQRTVPQNRIDLVRSLCLGRGCSLVFGVSRLPSLSIVSSS